MTADFARIPYDVLEKISVRVIDEVAGIGGLISASPTIYSLGSRPSSRRSPG